MANPHQGIQAAQQVSVEQLAVGMFVSDLDRPWLDTPFLVQGFLIEDEATLAQLRQLCRHVVVDPSRSNLDDNSTLAIPARTRKGVEDSGGVVRVVAAPHASRRPAQTRGWLSRVMQGLGQLREPVEPLITPVAADGSRSADASRIASQGQAPVLARRAQSSRISDERPDAPGSAAAVASVRPAPGPSSSLLDWLKDGLARLRVNHSDLAPQSDSMRDSVPRASRPSRGAKEIRVYQDSVPVEQELSRADKSFTRAAETVGAVIRDIRLGKGLRLEAVENVVEDLVESIIRHPGALQLVSRLREADESAYTHALQVAVLLVSLGRELGFSRTELTQLGQVGMLLDIGKMRVDQAILTKRGNLTPDEFEQVKRHVQHGLDIIASSDLAHPDVIAGVAQHHERLNGTGYPSGLKEGEIGAFGQMGGIVDAFCALTSIRPYAEPLSSYDAMRQLQGWSGTYFNAGLVEQFIQAIGIFPVGTLVELSSGEIGVVLEQSRALRLRPKVLVISTRDKTPLKIPVTLDLLYGGGSAADQRPYIRRGLPTESSAIDPKEYYLSSR
jgi:HD-GYP domain-containing protein (c-di-GMP phosphodiesterase class II)